MIDFIFTKNCLESVYISNKLQKKKKREEGDVAFFFLISLPKTEKSLHKWNKFKCWLHLSLIGRYLKRDTVQLNVIRRWLHFLYYFFILNERNGCNWALCKSCAQTQRTHLELISLLHKKWSKTNSPEDNTAISY